MSCNPSIVESCKLFHSTQQTLQPGHELNHWSQALAIVNACSYPPRLTLPTQSRSLHGAADARHFVAAALALQTPAP